MIFLKITWLFFLRHHKFVQFHFWTKSQIFFQLISYEHFYNAKHFTNIISFIRHGWHLCKWSTKLLFIYIFYLQKRSFFPFISPYLGISRSQSAEWRRCLWSAAGCSPPCPLPSVGPWITRRTCPSPGQAPRTCPTKRPSLGGFPGTSPRISAGPGPFQLTGWRTGPARRTVDRTVWRGWQSARWSCFYRGPGQNIILSVRGL